MSEKKTVSRNVAIVLAVLCIAALIGLNISVYTNWQQTNALQEKDTQNINSQGQIAIPKLISIDLKYTDDRSNANAPFLHITGYVVNVGNVKANNCTIHVNAIQNANATALYTTGTIVSLDAGNYTAIDVQFPYTGQALVAYSSYLEWTI